MSDIPGSTPPRQSNNGYSTIAVLDNEIEAQVLDAVLNDRNIPHLLVGYYDSVMGGVFQGTGGWGRVEAPAEFRDEINALITEIKSQPPELPESGEAGPAGS